MHAQITMELWQILAGAVVLAVPVTFGIYWAKDSFLRVPTVWREFWGKLGTKRTVTV